MFNWKKDNRGIISWVFLIIIAVIILSYLGFDLKSIIEGEQSQGNFAYLWNGGLYIWEQYLSSPILYFWNNIFIDLIWSSFTENMEVIKGGGPVISPDLAPEIF